MGIETAALALMVVGTGVAAYSAHEQGQAAQSLAEYNAKLAEQESLTAAQDAAAQANAERMQAQRIMAKQRAGFAAAGLVADTGSPLLVQVQQAGYLEQSAAETNRVGNIKSAAYRSQAKLDRMEGAAAARAGNLNAAATVLQGAGQMAGSYAKYKGV